MRSPFPGMDPYLEQHWGDVHSRLVTYIADALQPHLPAHLRARMQERVYIESPEEDRQEYYPDIRVFEHPEPRGGAGGSIATASPGVEVAESVAVDLNIESRTESYIEVIDVRSGHRVVTTIEVLSPSNKRAGEGQRLYLQKRKDMRRGKVNTVEIDLLREGERLLPIGPERIPARYRTPYQVWTWRAADPGRIFISRIPLRERLPAIPIPLRPTDPDVIVDLQAVLDQCYRNGGYDDIDYRVPPSPPLDPDDAAWADALLREKGLR